MSELFIKILFQWNAVSQPGFQALLILTSFVIAWGEAWYFDSRVVPQEIQAHDWFISKLIFFLFLILLT